MIQYQTMRKQEYNNHNTYNVNNIKNIRQYNNKKQCKEKYSTIYYNTLKGNNKNNARTIQQCINGYNNTVLNGTIVYNNTQLQ